MTARYRVINKTFIQPHMLFPGSIIETDSAPGNHLEPLNDEAKDKMEEWYNIEVDDVDKDGNVLVDAGGKVRKIRPNLSKKPAEAAKVERAVVTLVAPPEKETTAFMGLAEAMHARAEPDLVPQGPPLTPAPLETVDPSTTIVEAAPIPKKA